MNSSPNSCFYEFEGFVLDPLQRVVRTLADGKVVRLSARAFDALHLLVERHGQLVDKETLIKTLWPKVVVEENNLTQVIHSLRQSLGEKPGEHRFIATAPGRGYRFVAMVKEVPRASVTSGAVPAPASTELAVTGAARTGTTTYRSLFMPWGALALVLIGMASTWWLVGHNSTVNTTSVQQSKAMPRSSVAVLPFVNLTGDASKEYLGDGMAEELINTLNKVPGLKVPARTSSFAYKGRNTDIRQIAKDLGVGTILEGSVRAADKRIRITAQLINAQDGLHLWSETYDEELTDLFKLQDKLATQIVKALQVNLANNAEAATPHTAGTTDVEAYHLNLQAGYLLDAGQTVERATRAIELLQQAIMRDANYILAWTNMAKAHWQRGVILLSDEELMECERITNHVLELDPDNAQAHTRMAQLSFLRSFDRAEDHYRKALALTPADAGTHGAYVEQLVRVGRLRDAVAEARKAYAMAPGHPFTIGRLALALAVSGTESEAVKFITITRTIVGKETLIPSYAWMEFRIALREGQLDTATDKLVEARVRAIKDVDIASLRKLITAIMDPTKLPAALAIKNEFYPTTSAPGPDSGSSLQWSRDSGPACAAAYLYAAANALDAAYDLANRCLPEMIGGVAGQMWMPETAAFRRDPRFADYVVRIGRNLIEYWQQYGPPDNCDLKDRILTCH